jgi:hypothetical protein
MQSKRKVMEQNSGSDKQQLSLEILGDIVMGHATEAE